MSDEITVGAVYADLDPRSYYATLPDGSWPIPPDYEGKLGLRHRQVRVIGFEGEKVVVQNTHDERESKIQRKYFRASSTGTRGFKKVSDE